MKRYLFLFIVALFTLCSCNDGTKLSEAARKYGKEHMKGNPKKIEHVGVGIVKSIWFADELKEYAKGLEENKDKNPEAFQAEIDKANELAKKYRDEKAGTEWEFQLYYKDERGYQTNENVWMIVDNEENILYISMSRDELPTFPALKMLKDMGEL